MSTADLTRLSTAMAIHLMNLDVGTAIHTSTLALENNSLVPWANVIDALAISADITEIIKGCVTGDREKISEGMLHLSLDVAGAMMPVNPTALKRLADLGFKFAKGAITEGKVTQQTYKLTHVPSSYASAKPSVTQGLDVEKQLLLKEGQVGTYKELKKVGQPGDNLIPHHMPQNVLMNKEGVKTQDGICMMMEHPYPGTGGRHRRTETYGKAPKADNNINMRTELAKDIKDARDIYKQDDLYTSEIREGLQEVIKKNKESFPEIFKKDK